MVVSYLLWFFLPAVCLTESMWSRRTRKKHTLSEEARASGRRIFFPYYCFGCEGQQGLYELVLEVLDDDDDVVGGDDEVEAPELLVEGSTD